MEDYETDHEYNRRSIWEKAYFSSVMNEDPAATALMRKQFAEVTLNYFDDTFTKESLKPKSA